MTENSNSGFGAYMPLGLNQEHRLLLRETNEQHSIVFPPSLIITGLHLLGELNVEAVQKALNQIVQRHAGLRVAIVRNPAISSRERRTKLLEFERTGIVSSGLYVQIVRENAAVLIRRWDLGDRDDKDQRTAIRKLIDDEANRHFDHLRPPLLRAALIRLETRKHLLVIVLDHYVSDGWSVRIVEREFEALYAQSTGGMLGSFASGTLSFLEFVRSQEQKLRTSYFSGHAIYWREQWARFAGSRINVGHLPFALPNAGPSGGLFATEHIQFDELSSQRIRLFARQSQVSLYTLFAASFAILLRHYVGQSTLAWWGYFANRTRETQDVIGFITNRHLLGFDLSADPTVQSLLLMVQTVILEATEHQEMPIEYLWQTLGCYPRLNDALLVLDFHKVDERVDSKAFGELSIHRAKLEPTSAPRLASLGVYVDNDEQITMAAQYSTTHYPANSVKGFVDGLRKIVEALPRDSQARVSSFSQLLENVSSSTQVPRSEMAEFVLTKSDRLPKVEMQGN